MADKTVKSQKENNSVFSKAGPYLNIGYFFIGSISLFGFLGYKADQYFNSKVLFLLLGLFSGLALGFYNMFKLLAQLEKKPDNDKKNV